MLFVINCEKMNALKIGFIGGGKIAQAMAKGFLESGECIFHIIEKIKVIIYK